MSDTLLLIIDFRCIFVDPWWMFVDPWWMLVDSQCTSMDMRWVSDRFFTRFAIIRCPIDVR